MGQNPTVFLSSTYLLETQVPFGHPLSLPVLETLVWGVLGSSSGASSHFYSVDQR